MMKAHLVLILALTSALISCQNYDRPALAKKRIVTSFEEKQIRYLSPIDLMVLLHNTFALKDFSTIDKSCEQLTDSNRPLIGDDAPVTGTASSPEPGTGFVYWYSDCLNQYISALNAQFTMAEILEPKLVNDIQNEIGAGSDVNGFSFQNLEHETQDRLIRSLIHKMIGPADVIMDLGFCASEDDLVTIISKAVKDHNESLKEVTADFMYAIGMRSEFLSY